MFPLTHPSQNSKAPIPIPIIIIDITGPRIANIIKNFTNFTKNSFIFSSSFLPIIEKEFIAKKKERALNRQRPQIFIQFYVLICSQPYSHSMRIMCQYIQLNQLLIRSIDLYYRSSRSQLSLVLLVRIHKLMNLSIQPSFLIFSYYCTS